MSPEFEKLYLKSVVAGSEKQRWLASVIGDRGWRIDMEAGWISFLDDERWKVQLLGTESYLMQTWLWAWANKLPGHITVAAKELQEFGRSEKVSELTTPSFGLDALAGHLASVVAAEVLSAKAYYRAPYSRDGAAYLLIMDPAFPEREGDPVAELTTSIPRAFQIYDVANQRAAFQAYLEQLGLKPSQDGPLRLTVARSGLPTLKASFDKANRLQELAEG